MTDPFTLHRRCAITNTHTNTHNEHAPTDNKAITIIMDSHILLILVFKHPPPLSLSPFIWGYCERIHTGTSHKLERAKMWCTVAVWKLTGRGEVQYNDGNGDTSEKENGRVSWKRKSDVEICIFESRISTIFEDMQSNMATKLTDWKLLSVIPASQSSSLTSVIALSSHFDCLVVLWTWSSPKC